MRDLNERIKAKAESLVSANVVSKEVSAQTVANERAIVDANAKVNESLVNDLVNAKTAVSIGKEHKQIHRDIRVMLVNLGYSSAEFSAVYKDQQLIDRYA